MPMPAGRNRGLVDATILALGSADRGVPRIPVGLKAALHCKLVLLAHGMAV